MGKLQINFGLCRGSLRSFIGFGILELANGIGIENGHVGYRIGSPRSDKEAGRYMEMVIWKWKGQWEWMWEF